MCAKPLFKAANSQTVNGHNFCNNVKRFTIFVTIGRNVIIILLASQVVRSVSHFLTGSVKIYSGCSNRNIFS